jgi:two-component system response regulator CpxR
MKTPGILLIDDDAQLAALLEELFVSKGYAVDCVFTGEDGIVKAQRDAYDIVILDVMLPGIDGFQVLRRIRDQSEIPVVMLTAKGEDADRIAGFEGGADDYLSKPFNPRELLLRVRAILRRGARIETADSDKLSVGPLQLNIKQLEARVGDRLITLTGTEERVLEELMRSPGKVQTRESLTERALGRPRVAYDRAVDTHISHLRKKIGRDQLKRPVIRCIRGTGYLIVPDWQPENP